MTHIQKLVACRFWQAAEYPGKGSILAQTLSEDQRTRRRWLLLLLLLLSLGLGGGAYYWNAQKSRAAIASVEQQLDHEPTAAGVSAAPEAPVGALPEGVAGVEDDKAAARGVQRARGAGRDSQKKPGAPTADVIAEALLDAEPTGAGTPADGALPGSFAEGGGAPVIAAADPQAPGGAGGPGEANPAPPTNAPDAVTPFTPGGDGLPPGGTVLPAPVTPVPEPATWLMLLAGLGMTTWLARRRA